MARAARRQRVAGAVVAVLAGVLVAAAAQGQPAGTGDAAANVAVPAPHVRGLRTGAYDGVRLLAEAQEVCPTVRRLLDILQGTDVMVVVEVHDRVLNRTGHLTFMGTQHGTRWLHITLEAGNRRLEQMAWVAHELRHAVEVAGAPDVQDMDGLGRLYARIGTNLGDGQFETDAAVEAGHQALEEVYKAAARKK
jgi:hypothetical protein